MGQRDPEKLEHKKAAIEYFISGICGIFCLVTAYLGHQADGPAWARKMCFMQYPNGNGTFTSGPDDVYGVFMAAAALTVARRVFLDFIFSPIASMMSIVKPSDKIKFRQQGWVLVYYSTAWTWGFAEIYGSKYWLDRHALWQDYPQTAAMNQSFKFYLGFQMGFWIHMVFVTLVEPWQKDFVVMIAHHIVTITMFCGSYYIGMTRTAHAVLVEQDFADILLPAAKMCNYVALGQSPLKSMFQGVADGLFATFALAWIPTRHIILPIIYYSVWYEAETDFLAAGCSCGKGKECVSAPELGCILTKESFGNAVLVYKVFLGFFQCLLAFWLKELLVAVHKALMGGSVKGVEESSAQAIDELDKKKS